MMAADPDPARDLVHEQIVDLHKQHVPALDALAAVWELIDRVDRRASPERHSTHSTHSTGASSAGRTPRVTPPGALARASGASFRDHGF